ncbi:MAG: M23 family metallopeptidase [Alistipes sp.]|nr:M23 family metallopeptidase [Alistipes sp.]
MRRILFLTIALLCTPWVLEAQTRLNPADYIYPVQEVARLYSANFGEMRPGHFHAGIDIKTDGVEGKPLVAVADGYVSRIVVQAGGYGRAIYLTLRNGQTAVYGHLQRFRPDIEQRMQSERYARKSNSVDRWFSAEEFPVKQGDLIGYSGNSGSSGGPHLHFELRDTKDQRLRNVVSEGIINPTDSLPPRFMKLHYVEIDSLPSGVCIHRPMESYAVVRESEGRYRLTREEPIPVGRKGYFIAEVTDRRNGVHNTFAVHQIKAELDGKTIFEFRIDHFTHAFSRSCDAVSHYPLQLTSRNEAIRLAQLEGAPSFCYPTLVERGLVRTLPTEQRAMRLTTTDDCGNRSTLEFRIEGRSELFLAEEPSEEMELIRMKQPKRFRIGSEFSIDLPAEALYESCYAKAEPGTVPKVDSGLLVLSPAYRLLNPTTPMRKAATVTIRTYVPDSLRTKTLLGVRNRLGRATAAGGSYKEGEVSVATRTMGDWFVVADLLPPRVEPIFKHGAELRKQLTFKVSDNFSGIASWRLEIDGEWRPCDRYPSRGRLIFHFDRPAENRTHTYRLVVRDGVGNETVRKGTFRH